MTMTISLGKLKFQRLVEVVIVIVISHDLAVSFQKYNRIMPSFIVWR